MNIRKFAVLGLVLSSALVLSACSKYSAGTSQTPSQSTQQATSTSAAAATVTVTFSDSGASPSQATIKSGEAVKWVNNTSAKIQIASDPHPTHTANSEISNGQFVIEIAPGQSATSTLTKAGTWGYHDHLKPSVKGKITVQ